MVMTLMTVLQVHSRLRDLVDGHASVWARAGFKDQWPAPKSIWLFERLVSTFLFTFYLLSDLSLMTFIVSVVAASNMLRKAIISQKQPTMYLVRSHFVCHDIYISVAGLQKEEILKLL